MLALVVGLSGVQGATAQSTDQKISWAITDFAPITILKDGRAPATAAELGDGGLDRAMAELIQRLGRYSHDFQLVSAQRVWKTMERGVNVCFPSAFKTPEREKIAVFTPLGLSPPLALVMRKNDKARIVGEKNEVSLAELLRNHAVKGRLVAARSYGAAIDQVLANAEHPLPRDHVPTNGGQVRLVALGRFDYTIEYPLVSHYFDTLSGTDPALEVVTISEGKEWPVNYVACTRNDWGKAVIRDIDVAIREASTTPALRNVFSRWLPADYLERNRSKINAFYDARARSSYPTDADTMPR